MAWLNDEIKKYEGKISSGKEYVDGEFAPTIIKRLKKILKINEDFYARLLGAKGNEVH